LSEEEIKKMVKDAEGFADQDKERRAQQETRNAADNAVYGAEKFIRDYGDKLPEDKKSLTEERIADVKKAMESGNVDDMRRSTDELMRQVQELGAEMYQQGAGEASNGNEPDNGSQPTGEDVVDGEVVDN
jgi:molecular chaperone DnaK